MSGSVLPVIRTARLRLRPFELSDAPAVERLASEWEVARTTLTIPHPYPSGEAEDWIRTVQACLEAERLYTFAITRSEELVGAISLDRNRRHKKGELGYWVGLPYWGRGYATEAAEAVISFGFLTLRLNRIFGCCLAHNKASARVMEKAGMRYEGTLRQDIFSRGQYEDVAYYGILLSEYLAAGVDRQRARLLRHAPV